MGKDDEIVEQMNLAAEQETAKANVADIISNMPSDLVRIESRLYQNVVNSKLNPVNKLTRLYEVMDKLFEFVAPFIPCSKGCDKCCHYSITVSEIEIQLIEKEQKIKRNGLPVIETNHHGNPCAFLKNNVCSIYKSRPYVCRRHTMMASSSYYCDPNISLDYKFAMLQMSEPDRLYEHIVSLSVSRTLIDIRDAFVSQK